MAIAASLVPRILQPAMPVVEEAPAEVKMLVAYPDRWIAITDLTMDDINVMIDNYKRTPPTFWYTHDLIITF